MTVNTGGWGVRDGDPLTMASVGTALAGGASLVWPELIAGTLSLAVVTSFVVWIRAIRALRQRRSTGYHPARLVPFLVLGTVGWSTALLLGPTLPSSRAPVLGIVAVGLWVLAGSRRVGF
jgi:hypothetical protein